MIARNFPAHIVWGSSRSSPASYGVYAAEFRAALVLCTVRGLKRPPIVRCEITSNNRMCRFLWSAVFRPTLNHEGPRGLQECRPGPLKKALR